MTRAAPIVAIVGAGGLGHPVSLALAEAGFPLRLIDDDQVELSNLPRQVLFSTPDLGRPKLDALADALRARFAVPIDLRPGRLTAANRDAFIGDAALAIDATDDPAARFLINDWGLAHERPVVIGGVHRFQGLVFAHSGKSPCFRCLFEEEGPAVETCAVGGVLGPMTGLVGHLMAERALALLAGDLHTTTGFITTLDGRARKARHVPLPLGCPHCVGVAPTPVSAAHAPPPAAPSQAPSPAPALATLDPHHRYARQVVLAEIGRRGQERFKHAALSVAGDTPAAETAATYLAAAGIGRLILAPSLAARLQTRLAELNPDCRLVPAAIDARSVTPSAPQRRANGAQVALDALLQLAGLPTAGPWTDLP